MKCVRNIPSVEVSTSPAQMAVRYLFAKAQTSPTWGSVGNCFSEIDKIGFNYTAGDVQLRKDVYICLRGFSTQRGPPPSALGSCLNRPWSNCEPLRRWLSFYVFIISETEDGV